MSLALAPRLPADRRAIALRALAWSGVGLMAVVTSASAWLRLAPAEASALTWINIARAAHRGSATLVLLATVALVLLCFAGQPRRARTGARALVLLGLALALAALGLVTRRAAGAAWPVPALLALTWGNLLGGLLMLALSWRLLRGLTSAAPAAPTLVRAAWIGVGLWLLQAALGAAAGAGLRAIAPPLHLLLALVALPWALHLGWSARRTGRRAEGTALIGVALLQGALGIAATANDSAPLLVLAHNALAATGLATMAGLGTTDGD